MSSKEDKVNKILDKYRPEINKATEGFIESIINGEAFAFPVETKKGSNIDNFIYNHPMFDKSIKKEHENFKNEK